MAQRSESTPPIPRWLVRWAAVGWRLLIIAAALVVLGYLFTKLRLIVLPVIVALFLSTVLVPPASWLRRRYRFPPLLATWAVLLGALVIIGALVVGLYTVTQGQFNSLGHELSGGVNRAERYLTNGPFHFSHKQINGYVDQAKNFFTKNQGTIVQGALSGATIVLEVVGGALLSLVLTFFFVKDGDKIAQWALSLFSERRVTDMRTLGRQTWATMGAYVRGTAANGFVNAVLLAMALLGLGVPLVLPLALLTFLGGFLPIVGAIVSGAFAALVALVIKGPIAALIIVGVTIVIHNVEGYIVGPKVLGHEVNLHPVAIILVLAAGTALGGIIGAFLAVPLTAILIAVYNHYHHPDRLEPVDEEDQERGPPESLPDRTEPVMSPTDGGAPIDAVSSSEPGFPAR